MNKYVRDALIGYGAKLTTKFVPSGVYSVNPNYKFGIVVIHQLKEAQTLILRLLNRRVGTVSPELQVRVKALLLPQLEELGEALLDFTSLADLVDWIDRV